MINVDVLVVNYLTPELTLQAVKSVSGPGVRVLVQDNSGDLGPDVAELAEVSGDGANLLFAEANNRLFARSGAPLVLLLNPDVVLEEPALAGLVAALEKHPSAWGAAPQLRDPDGELQNYFRRLPGLRALLADRCPPLRVLWKRELALHYCRDMDLTVSGLVDQPPAACLLVRRDRIEGTLFDPSYPLFFNDTDLARRLNSKGSCLYVAEVHAIHHVGASINRARVAHRSWIRRQYDDSLLRYARSNLRGWQLLVPIVMARRAAARRPVPPPRTRPPG